MVKPSGVTGTVTAAIAGAVSALILSSTVSVPAQEIPLNHPPQAQMAWTTVGAVGVPDDGDGESIRFGANGAAAIADGIAYPAQAVLRYNVVPVLGLYAGGSNEGPLPRCLSVGFRDNGPDARVIVTLKRVVAAINEVRTIATFDSDVTRGRTPNSSTGNLFDEDFLCTIPDGTFAGMNDRSFFVEATLIRRTAAGNPGLQTITIEASSQ